MILAMHILWNLSEISKNGYLFFLCSQPVILDLYKTILWRLGVPNYKHQYICFQSVIILEQGSSTLYDSRACNGCWQWLPTGGIINQWVIDDTLWCYTMLWLVHGCVINNVVCSLNIHCSSSSIQCLMLGFQVCCSGCFLDFHMAGYFVIMFIQT